MKSLITIILFGAIGLKVSAQGPLLELKTSIDKVTLYFEGAQVTRSGSLSLPEGRSEVVVRNLSHLIRFSTVQLKSESGITLLGVRLDTEKENETSEKTGEEDPEKNRKLAALTKKIEADSFSKTLLENEENMINQNLFRETEKLKPTEIKAALDLLQPRLNYLRRQIHRLDSSIGARWEQINILQENGQALDTVAEPKKPSLRFMVSCSKAENVRFSLTYFTWNAGWVPGYDLKIKDAKSPLSLRYKARIFQATGEDWKDIPITLTNADPDQKGGPVALLPYYVTKGFPQSSRVAKKRNYFAKQLGRVYDNAALPIPYPKIIVDHFPGGRVEYFGNSKGEFELLVPEGNNCNFTIVSLKGHQAQYVRSWKEKYYLNPVATTSRDAKEEEKPMISASMSMIPAAAERQGMVESKAKRIKSEAQENQLPQVQESQNQNHVSFEIREKFRLNSRNPEVLVDVQEMEIPAVYSYVATPKVSPDVYLTARLADWQELNLLEGEATIYFENTFIGNFRLKPDQEEDTLTLNLGADPAITVKRTKLMNKSHTSLIGTGRKVTRDFEFQAKNGKSIPIDITIYDQYPVSDQDKVKVYQVEHSGAKLETTTGELRWDFVLPPKKEKKWQLKYEIEYPNGQPVYLE